MPVYSYALTNGKTLRLEGDIPPTDADVEQAAKNAGVELELTEREHAAAGMRGVGEAFGSTWPVLASVAALPAAAAISVPAAVGMLRTAAAGAIPGAAVGGGQGLLSGGPRGAIRGAMHGAITGAGAALGARGAVGMLRTGSAAAQGAAAGSAAEALRQFGNRQVLTPQEQTVKDALMKRAEREASESGLVNAGTQAREPGFLESLFR